MIITESGPSKIFPIPIITYCRMEMLKINSSLLVVCLLAIPSLSQAAMEAGTIKAFRITGDVQLLDESTGVSSPIEDGHTFSQGYTVTTGADSSVVLLFSNGSSIIMNADSTLSVAKFLQEPYDPALGEYSELEADPSQSDTLLKLDYGEIIGNVKRLRSASVYLVETPAGSVGIRGTTFRIRVRRTIDPTTGLVAVRLIVTNADGNVEVATIETGGVFESVPAGTEITVEAQVNVDTGKLTITLVKKADVSKEIIKRIVQRVKRTQKAVAAIKQEILRKIRSREDPDSRNRDRDVDSSIVGTQVISLRIQVRIFDPSTDSFVIKEKVVKVTRTLGVATSDTDVIFKFVRAGTEITVNAEIDAETGKITFLAPANAPEAVKKAIIAIIKDVFPVSVNRTPAIEESLSIISIEGGGSL